MSWFDSIGSETVKKLDPLLRDAENRLGGIAHGLADRFDSAEIIIPEIRIQIKLNPIPKAKPVE